MFSLFSLRLLVTSLQLISFNLREVLEYYDSCYVRSLIILVSPTGLGLY